MLVHKTVFTQIDLHPESFATFTQKSVPQKNLYTQKLGDTDADTDKGILRRKKAAWVFDDWHAFRAERVLIAQIQFLTRVVNFLKDRSEVPPKSRHSKNSKYVGVF